MVWPWTRKNNQPRPASNNTRSANQRAVSNRFSSIRYSKPTRNGVGYFLPKQHTNSRVKSLRGYTHPSSANRTQANENVALGEKIKEVKRLLIVEQEKQKEDLIQNQLHEQEQLRQQHIQQGHRLEKLPRSPGWSSLDTGQVLAFLLFGR